MTTAAFFTFAALAALTSLFVSRRRRTERVSKLARKIRDVGACFGVDIGGTLTKLVFFSPKQPLANKTRHQLADGRERTESLQAEAAIAAIQSFISQSDTYGDTGVRDCHLVLDVPGIGGTMHFIR